jgi:hypothetical protein
VFLELCLVFDNCNAIRNFRRQLLEGCDFTLGFGQCAFCPEGAAAKDGPPFTRDIVGFDIRAYCSDIAKLERSYF